MVFRGLTKLTNSISNSNSVGLCIPLLDWLIIGGYILGTPLVIGTLVLLAGVILNSDFNFLLIILIITFLTFLLVTFYFFEAYKNLHNYASSVSFFHFYPSWRDVIIHLLRQFYLVIFISVILGFLLLDILIRSFNYWIYFGIALTFSLILQCVLVFLAMNSKRKLLATAQESVKDDIIDYIHQNHPNGHLIDEFRFADIQIETLFLSAGVMSYGRKSICLISRYFNWKLSDKELIAVLSHEEGHIANHHILKSYFHTGIEALLRTFRIFIILLILIFISKSKSFLEVFLTDLPSLIVVLMLISFIFLSSTFFNLYRRYRSFLGEIRADYYGSDLVGSEILAITLRKLPSLIPSPIGYNQSSFLGFRIALLRNLTVSN